MSPWAIFSWIAAICVALIVVSITLAIVVTLIRNLVVPKPSERARRAQNAFTARAVRNHERESRDPFNPSSD